MRYKRECVAAAVKCARGGSPWNSERPERARNVRDRARNIRARPTRPHRCIHA